MGIAGARVLEVVVLLEGPCLGTMLFAGYVQGPSRLRRFRSRLLMAAFFARLQLPPLVHEQQDTGYLIQGRGNGPNLGGHSVTSGFRHLDPYINPKPDSAHNLIAAFAGSAAGISYAGPMRALSERSVRVQ